MPVRREGDDPISLLLAPPPDETDEQRVLRLQREAEARRISDEIDEDIKKEYAALKKQNVLKMLLLGQSESGKTTTLKNIQIIQAPDLWLAERTSWRIVIQLNLVRAVNTILDIVSAELADPLSDPRAGDEYPSSPTMSDPIDGSLDHDDPEALYDDLSSPSTQSHFSLPSSPLSMPSPGPGPARPSLHALTAVHASLWLRLTPLRQVEADLKLLLGAPSEEVTEASLHGDHSTMVATPFEAGAYPLEALPLPLPGARRPREFCVRSHAAWKESLRAGGGARAGGGGMRVSGRSSAGVDATEVIAGCRDDIELLWSDNAIRDILARRRIGLEDAAEYFLDGARRIGSRSYEPTDEDVLHARLRTVGVQEYRLPLDRNNPHGKEWRIFDVGGARTNRSVWLPYFEDIDSILFLAPISCFDEHLAEDRRINRLKDSFILWKSIVGSKLLQDAVVILFLNKCDLLEKKLKAGARVNKYIPRYGDKENKMSVFGKYIRDKFRDYMKEYSPIERPFYGYLTSVVNKKATAVTIRSIQDGVFQANLRDASFV